MTVRNLPCAQSLSENGEVNDWRAKIIIKNLKFFFKKKFLWIYSFYFIAVLEFNTRYKTLEKFTF